MAMTGGKAYCVLSKTSVDGTNKVDLYIYVKEKSQSTSSNSTTLQLGMYVNSTYAIGSWTDFNGSYIGTATSGSNCHSFNGTISYGSGTRWLVQNKEVTVKHDSDGTKTVKIYWKWGVSAYTTYIVGYQNPSGNKSVTLTPIKSSCTKPSTFTASSNNFEDNVTLKWSGAGSGIGNSIASYLIKYRTSSNGSSWGSWTNLSTVASTSASGSKTIDMSSKVSRGYYVQFAIRTQPSNTSYASSYAYSDTLRRKPYTKCTAPSSFGITSDQFETTITLKWSGASAGTNNSISSYYIQYRVSDNGSTWGEWTKLKTISTNKAYYSVDINVSDKVERGQYVQCRIRTQGSAGSSYYSSYKTSGSIQRNPYTDCTAPSKVTLASTNDLKGNAHNDIFQDTIIVSWSKASSGTNNSVDSYKIEYQTATTQNGFSGSWTYHSSTKSTSTAINAVPLVDIGKYIRFRVTAISNIAGYDSTPTISSTVMKRNGSPNSISNFSVTPKSLEFSKGENIKLTWSKSVDTDDNVYYYDLEVCVRSKKTTTDDTWYTGDTWYKLLGSRSENPKTITLSDNTIALNSSAVSHTVSSDNTYYNQVDNISSTTATTPYISFRIRAVDVFGASSAYTYSHILTRHDLPAVYYGIDDEWVKCQLFVGVNNKWVEHIVYVGEDGSWKETAI